MFNFRKKSKNKQQVLKSAAMASSPTQTLSPVMKAAAMAAATQTLASDPVPSQEVASPTKVSFAELLIAIRDRSAEKARDAALTMGTCGDPAAVDVLIEVTCNDDMYFHTVVRAAAVKSLGRIADPRAMDALIGATRDTMAEVSDEAIHALAATKDQRAVDPLIRIVRNSDNFFLPNVRRSAIAALKLLGGPAATTELKAVAANPAEDPTIRAAAQ